jgi:hypothetical protein
LQNLIFAKNTLDMASATAIKPKEIDIDSLIGTAERLGDNDLERFADSINLIRVKRRIAANPQTEEEILEELKKDLSPKERKRYKTLIAKCRNETISETEHQEMFEYIEKSEELSVYRLERAVKLAAMRNLPFDTVWKQMWFYKKNNVI